MDFSGSIKIQTMVDVKTLLEVLREEFGNAIDNTLDALDEGVFDVPDSHENAGAKGMPSGLSHEDAEFLRSVNQ